MKRRDLGIAVIGAGRIGTLRARLAAKHPAVRFLAISDRDPARAKALAETAGADLHSADNDAIIAHPAVTAVIVSTPEQEHVAPVCAALARGLPVLVEKPLALTLKGADDIWPPCAPTMATCGSATAAATRNVFCVPRSR
jgi:predicted dehydrogenase